MSAKACGFDVIFAIMQLSAVPKQFTEIIPTWFLHYSCQRDFNKNSFNTWHLDRSKYLYKCQFGFCSVELIYSDFELINKISVILDTGKFVTGISLEGPLKAEIVNVWLKLVSTPFCVKWSMESDIGVGGPKLLFSYTKVIHFFACKIVQSLFFSIHPIWVKCLPKFSHIHCFDNGPRTDTS